MSATTPSWAGSPARSSHLLGVGGEVEQQRRHQVGVGREVDVLPPLAPHHVQAALLHRDAEHVLGQVEPRVAEVPLPVAPVRQPSAGAPVARRGGTAARARPSHCSGTSTPIQVHSVGQHVDVLGERRRRPAPGWRRPPAGGRPRSGGRGSSRPSSRASRPASGRPSGRRGRRSAPPGCRRAGPAPPATRAGGPAGRRPRPSSRSRWPELAAVALVDGAARRRAAPSPSRPAGGMAASASRSAVAPELGDVVGRVAVVVADRVAVRRVRPDEAGVDEPGLVVPTAARTSRPAGRPGTRSRCARPRSGSGAHHSLCASAPGNDRSGSVQLAGFAGHVDALVGQPPAPRQRALGLRRVVHHRVEARAARPRRCAAGDRRSRTVRGSTLVSV